MEGTALITGGTGGLGTAVVDAFLADGWRVVAPARGATGSGRPALERRQDLEAVRADLLDADEVGAAVQLAAGNEGAPLRAVVNLVGAFFDGPRVHELSLEDFERQLALNLRPTFLVTRAALPHLLAAGGGAIVCVGSRAALRPYRGAAAYATAKAAVIAFARAVAADYRDDNIRCNAVLPSVIDTPTNRRAMPDADVEKWVKPEEIARVIRFLCSEESGATSGAEIPVYGRA
ncbi:MAG: SDR family NAD(P)-dependent oxidoreductase [Solirubrobacteraceae bacterium]